MKRKRNTGMLYLFLFAMISCTVTFAQPKEFSVPLSQSTKPGQLVMTLFCGSVKVVGYAGKEVLVTPSVPYDTSKITLSEKANVISIKVEKPYVINFVIKVPRDFSVVVKTQTAGTITIENVNGNHEVYVPDGTITMSDIEGSVSASNVKGAVKVSISSIKMDNPLALSSVMGNVELTLAANQKANISMQTTYGRLFSEFDIVKNPPGDAKNIIGKINGGGSDILLKTVGGNVNLRKAK
jgi:hypothetical protein